MVLYSAVEVYGIHFYMLLYFILHEYILLLHLKAHVRICSYG